VRVNVAYHRKNNERIWYKKDVTLEGSIIVEGLHKLAPLPAAEATLALIAQDTRQKYVKHVEKLAVCGTDTVAVLAATSGAKREFTFKTVALTLDTARDASNMGGKEYKYFVSGLRDPATQEIVDFQTNCPQLGSYIADHPEVREQFLAPKLNSPFSVPSDFDSKK
jgi:hypothetical protein